MMRVRAGLVVALSLAAGAGLWALVGAESDPAARPPDPIADVRGQGKPVLVEFGASSCAACRQMKAVLAELRASHGDRLVILDIEFGTQEGRHVLREHGIQAIPTQLFFAADGTELGRHLGAIPAAAILDRLGLADG